MEWLLQQLEIVIECCTNICYFKVNANSLKLSLSCHQKRFPLNVKFINGNSNRSTPIFINPDFNGTVYQKSIFDPKIQNNEYTWKKALWIFVPKLRIFLTAKCAAKSWFRLNSWILAQKFKLTEASSFLHFWRENSN